MQTSSVQIYKAGKDHCVDVPEHVIAGFRRSGHIPVKGRINDRVEFRAALVPSGDRHYRLFINEKVRYSANFDFHQSVGVTLGPDLPTHP